MVNVRKARIDDFRRHEVRKHFFRPDVVEPLHRDKVAKPHVCGFVGDKSGTAQEPGFRRRLIQEQAGRSVLNRTNMLHAAVLEGRNQCETKLLVRIVYSAVLLEPVDRRRMQGENVVDVPRDFFRYRFPDAAWLSSCHRFPW